MAGKDTVLKVLINWLLDIFPCNERKFEVM